MCKQSFEYRTCADNVPLQDSINHIFSGLNRFFKMCFTTLLIHKLKMIFYQMCYMVSVAFRWPFFVCFDLSLDYLHKKQLETIRIGSERKHAANIYNYFLNCN